MPLIQKPNIQHDIERVHKRGLDAVGKILDNVIGLHRELISPWDLSKDKPKFEKEIRDQPGRIEGLVKLTAEAAEQATLSVWQLLDRGTRIRYMKLSEDWESKTSVGSITSGPGAGHKVGLDVKNPEGGIHKRDFGKNVGEAAKTKADQNIKSAYGKGF